ncbi:MAG: histidine phosphatase family protein [Lachnospiraceae bacterium]|nr:histidine phosphatase family protein [Lachnospiraceae bacterium]
MRILFVRHGDPDYANDTLTEKGHREAACLAETAPDLNMGDCYVSPLGRAKDTAAYCLKKLGKTAETMEWLREFSDTVDINGSEELLRCYPNTRIIDGRYKTRIPWDMVPGYFTEHPEYIDRFAWRNSEVAKHSRIVEDYDAVIAGMDRLLEKYGYVREGDHYRVEKGCSQTITLFCHFGVTCVLLSHLWNMSPFILWHSLGLLPTSVSELVTEEREKGIAYFRGLRLGDQSHLYAGKEEPSFACRFCELYGNENERH